LEGRYASGEVDRFGRITKWGDGTVRTLLYEAAWLLQVPPFGGSRPSEDLSSTHTSLPGNQLDAMAPTTLFGAIPGLGARREYTSLAVAERAT